MKKKRPSAADIWKQFHDVLVPHLPLSLTERAVYSHLVRHSHLEGTSRISLSMAWLAHGTGISAPTVRNTVRRLVAHGALRLISRSKAGHVIDVRLPGQILRQPPGANQPRQTPLLGAANLEQADFMANKNLRRLIYARDGGICFYCLRLDPAARCLDHVIPRAKLGVNSYRNLVSSCVECNSQKGEQPADQLLQKLYRDRRLTSKELAARLRALDALAAGKLRPPLPDAQRPLRGGTNLRAPSKSHTAHPARAEHAFWRSRRENLPHG